MCVGFMRYPTSLICAMEIKVGVYRHVKSVKASISYKKNSDNNGND